MVKKGSSKPKPKPRPRPRPNPKPRPRPTLFYFRGRRSKCQEFQNSKFLVPPLADHRNKDHHRRPFLCLQACSAYEFVPNSDEFQPFSLFLFENLKKNTKIFKNFENLTNFLSFLTKNFCKRPERILKKNRQKSSEFLQIFRFLQNFRSQKFL